MTGLTQVREAADAYRDDPTQAEALLLALRGAVCHAYSAGAPIEEIAEACGWTREQVTELLQLC
jgi:hypothetical protein